MMEDNKVGLAWPIQTSNIKLSCLKPGGAKGGSSSLAEHKYRKLSLDTITHCTRAMLANSVPQSPCSATREAKFHAEKYIVEKVMRKVEGSVP